MPKPLIPTDEIVVEVELEQELVDNAPVVPSLSAANSPASTAAAVRTRSSLERFAAGAAARLGRTLRRHDAARD
jgi:hypothetical protein